MSTAEFSSFLDRKPYCTISQLIALGLFGSQSAASAAIRRGDLPSIRISPKRTVIPRSAVLEYFKSNLVEAAGNK